MVVDRLNELFHHVLEEYGVGNSFNPDGLAAG
jgi:hypothetical protein